MKTFPRRLLRHSALLVAIGALAANACGGDDSVSPTDTAASSGPGASTATTGTSGTATTSSSSGGGQGGAATTATTGTGGTGGSTTGTATASGGGGQGGATTTTGTGSTGSGATVDCTPPSGALPALKLTQIANGFSNPVLVKGDGQDATRLFVVEQTGTIQVLVNGVQEPTPFLDVSGGDFNAGGEQGLLGLAFHPDYASNGRFFVHYSDGDGDTKIEEYHRSADPNVADAAPVGTVLTVSQPESNHNGGSIEFGADGMLYIFLGDGGGGGDAHPPIGNGQKLDTLLGKVSRIDVSTLPYTIPAGNLPGADPEVWDYGLRNPYRDSFDACTGDLYIADVGQGSWEEVNVEPMGQGNKNYGWRCREGMHPFNANCGPNAATAVDPLVEYSHGGGRCSVTGGYVYRGAAIPALRGTYFYGDYCSGQIFTFVYSGGAATAQTERTQELGSGGMNISSFGQDASGEVYVVDHSGSIHRVDAQ